MSDLVVISQHEKGFWQADFYKDGGDIPSCEWDSIGASPDDFITMKIGESASCTHETAQHRWPGAVITFAVEDEDENEDDE